MIIYCYQIVHTQHLTLNTTDRANLERIERSPVLIDKQKVLFNGMIGIPPLDQSCPGQLGDTVISGFHHSFDIIFLMALEDTYGIVKHSAPPLLRVQSSNHLV